MAKYKFREDSWFMGKLHKKDEEINLPERAAKYPVMANILVPVTVHNPVNLKPAPKAKDNERSGTRKISSSVGAKIS